MVTVAEGISAPSESTTLPERAARPWPKEAVTNARSSGSIKAGYQVRLFVGAFHTLFISVAPWFSELDLEIGRSKQFGIHERLAGEAPTDPEC